MKAKVLTITAYIHIPCYTSKVVYNVADAYPCAGCYYYIFLFGIDKKITVMNPSVYNDQVILIHYSQYRKVYDNSTFSISQFFSQQGIQSSPSEYSFGSICYKEVVITSYRWCLYPPRKYACMHTCSCYSTASGNIYPA